jgi:plasmid stabilization system protein ParE
VKVRYSALARTDVRQAKAFYGRDSEQAPKQFAAELRRALQRIREHPQIGVPYEFGTRRFIMNQFHHSVVYYLTDEGIYVVAVEHHSRDSGYWHAAIER